MTRAVGPALLLFSLFLASGAYGTNVFKKMPDADIRVFLENQGYSDPVRQTTLPGSLLDRELFASRMTVGEKAQLFLPPVLVATLGVKRVIFGELSYTRSFRKGKVLHIYSCRLDSVDCVVFINDNGFVYIARANGVTVDRFGIYYVSMQRNVLDPVYVFDLEVKRPPAAR